MPSRRIAKKRSASSSVSAPAGSQVYAQFAAERTRSTAAWSSRSVRSAPASRPSRKSARSAPRSASLGEELLGPVAFQVAPLPHEDRCDVQLLGDDAQVGAQRKPDPLARRRAVGDRVQRIVEGTRALAHRLVEQVLLESMCA